MVTVNYHPWKCCTPCHSLHALEENKLHNRNQKSWTNVQDSQTYRTVNKVISRCRLWTSYWKANWCWPWQRHRRTSASLSAVSHLHVNSFTLRVLWMNSCIRIEFNKHQPRNESPSLFMIIMVVFCYSPLHIWLYWDAPLTSTSPEKKFKKIK